MLLDQHWNLFSEDDFSRTERPFAFVLRSVACNLGFRCCIIEVVLQVLQPVLAVNLDGERPVDHQGQLARRSFLILRSIVAVNLHIFVDWLVDESKARWRLGLAGEVDAEGKLVAASL